jgi:hypothetical protein
MDEQIPTITIECWPTIHYPTTLDELSDHEMRRKYCERVLATLPRAHRGMETAMRFWHAYCPFEGYTKPEVTPEQREEWRANQKPRRYYVAQRA